MVYGGEGVVTGGDESEWVDERGREERGTLSCSPQRRPMRPNRCPRRAATCVRSRHFVFAHLFSRVVAQRLRSTRATRRSHRSASVAERSGRAKATTRWSSRRAPPQTLCCCASATRLATLDVKCSSEASSWRLKLLRVAGDSAGNVIIRLSETCTTKCNSTSRLDGRGYRRLPSQGTVAARHREEDSTGAISALHALQGPAAWFMVGAGSGRGLMRLELGEDEHVCSQPNFATRSQAARYGPRGRLKGFGRGCRAS